MKEQIIKRTSQDGFIFFNEDRTYRSKPFKTKEARELAIEKYLKDELVARREMELKRKREYDLTHDK